MHAEKFRSAITPCVTIRVTSIPSVASGRCRRRDVPRRYRIGHAMAPLPSLHTTACFLVVCVASSTLAEYCRKAKLPLITGYILAGIVCGPCVLSLLSQPASAQLSELINDDAMGFIGFSAGSKFLLSELRGQMRPVLCLLAGLVGTTYLLVGCGVWFASPWLSLTSDATAEKRLAVALIVACLAVARSPSSAIALVSELDAHGALTTSCAPAGA